ncbi:MULTISPECIES: hypothetical protein [Pacificibacter]|uniref:hypothetical protein n=1 Tax=Pacificibacter TaxID=1042323 RepID=UPI001C08DBDE|nr:MULTISPECIES: hypothetical protein [Pacificibacter]MBU2935060.1 hypothetical protein [Pacificibacter marinus]MDO6617281.1 hypothetical protein [Pacificibacter sp. 1_MG-2023]
MVDDAISFFLQQWLLTPRFGWRNRGLVSISRPDLSPSSSDRHRDYLRGGAVVIVFVTSIGFATMIGNTGYLAGGGMIAILCRTHQSCRDRLYVVFSPVVIVAFIVFSAQIELRDLNDSDRYLFSFPGLLTYAFVGD